MGCRARCSVQSGQRSAAFSLRNRTDPVPVFAELELTDVCSNVDSFMLGPMKRRFMTSRIWSPRAAGARPAPTLHRPSWLRTRSSCSAPTSKLRVSIGIVCQHPQHGAHFDIEVALGLTMYIPVRVLPTQINPNPGDLFQAMAALHWLRRRAFITTSTDCVQLSRVPSNTCGEADRCPRRSAHLRRSTQYRGRCQVVFQALECPHLTQEHAR